MNIPQSPSRQLVIGGPIKKFFKVVFFVVIYIFLSQGIRFSPAVIQNFLYVSNPPIGVYIQGMDDQAYTLSHLEYEQSASTATIVALITFCTLLSLLVGYAAPRRPTLFWTLCLLPVISITALRFMLAFAVPLLGPPYGSPLVFDAHTVVIVIFSIIPGLLFRQGKSKKFIAGIFIVLAVITIGLLTLTFRSPFQEKTLTAEICAGKNTTGDKDVCYGKLANSLNKPEFCDVIAQDASKRMCYYDLAPKILDSSLCEKLQSNSLSSQCYYGIAVKTLDRELCSKITNNLEPFSPSGCTKAIDILQPTFQECTSSTDTDACLYEKAVKGKLMQMCGYIKDGRTKNSCLETSGTTR